jgi:AraC-like DNA-binding protein
MLETLKIPAGMDGRVWLHEPQGHLHHWHHHAEPEFNLVLRGTATYLLDGRRYQIGRHSLIWLFPLQEHLLVDLSEDLAMWIGVVRPKALSRLTGSGSYAGLAAADPIGGFCKNLPPADVAHIDRICRDIAAPAPVERVNAALPYLFASAWDRFQTAGSIDGQGIPPALQSAIALLARDPTAPAEVVAGAGGITRFHLARLFRSELHTTLSAWRTRARIERALSLRRRHPRSAWTSIAFDAGFGSYAQFHRAFRCITGRTPRNWQPG